MAVRVADYISKKNIYRWLENYGSLEAGDQIDDGQVQVVNSGPKNMDGVSAGKLNKIMLDDAIEHLKRSLPFSWACIYFTYLRPVMQKRLLKSLSVKRAVYIRGRDQGVEYIYRAVNGGLAEKKERLEGLEAAPGKLLAKIKQGMD